MNNYQVIYQIKNSQYKGEFKCINFKIVESMIKILSADDCYNFEIIKLQYPQF
jgi:hypothetical protein